MSIPSLRQNERGIYEIYWTDNGRGKRVSTRTRDLDDAKGFFATWLTLGRADAPASSTMTVSTLWAEYETRHVRDPDRVAAPDSLIYAWRNLEPFFGKKLVAEIGQTAAEAYEEARTSGRIGRQAKPATVRKELITLRACLNWCADPKRRLLDAGAVPVFDLPRDSDPRDRWLRTDELQRLFAAAAARREDERLSRLERFLWLALETAARKQAILDLTWDRVDFVTNTIHYPVPGQRQTKKRRADVPISKSLRPVLERAFAERRSNSVMDGHGEIWPTLQEAVAAAGLAPGGVRRTAAGKPTATGISPHTLRHTAATHMARNGVPLWQIAKILGNSLAMVERVYAKWCPDSPETTVDRISGGLIKEVA